LAILVPEHGDRSIHLKLLALVAELVSQPGFRTRLDLATDPAGVALAFSDGLSALRA
jgi:mannitol/fructose-specific phosphotransferase system IIA component (Ntr-type)